MRTTATPEDWPARVSRLEEEVAGLRRAMRTRGLIEQAKGMLAERLGCDPESAFGILSTRSQQTNTPLVTIAADLVGAPAEPPAETGGTAPHRSPALRLAPGADAPDLEAITELRPHRKSPALPGPAARDLRLAIAALDAATDLDELTQAVVTVGLRDQPGAAAALFLTEPDGALRMLACHGWPAQAISEWRRLPSSINTTVSQAVRTGAPVAADQSAEHDYVLIGPSTQARLAFPLSVSGRVIGAFQFALPTQRLTEVDRLRLSHLAVAAGRALRRLWPSAVAAHTPAADLDWVRSVLDALHDPSHLLSPVRDDTGKVIDFIIEATGGDLAQPDHAAVGRRLLDAYPHLAGNGVFAGYVDVLADGTAWHAPDLTEEIIVNGRRRRIVVSRRATRVGGAVLATWRRLDEMISKDRHLGTLEALGGFGWAEWDLNTTDARWSAGMYRLMGRDPSRPPIPFENLADHVDPADRPRVETFIADVLAGRDAVADVRGKGEEIRWLRLFCEAEPAATSLKTIQLLAQDVTDKYERDQHLRSVQSRAAAGRLRLASQQELMARLVHLLYPKETVSLETDDVVVRGRHVLHDAERPLRADFCDAVELPDGRILVFVGDMFGAGITAAATAVRLVRPVIALGIAGTPLTRILEVLNRDLHGEAEPSLASLLIAAFDPRTGEFRYVSAGHLPPVLLRPGSEPGSVRSRLLNGTAGPALGLIEQPEYTQEDVRLVSGDVVVCYTDGLIDQRGPDPLRALTKVLTARFREGGAQALMELPVPQGTDETCVALMEVKRIKRPYYG